MDIEHQCLECKWPMEVDDFMGQKVWICTNPKCFEWDVKIKVGKCQRCTKLHGDDVKDETLCEIEFCNTHCDAHHRHIPNHMTPDDLLEFSESFGHDQKEQKKAATSEATTTPKEDTTTDTTEPPKLNDLEILVPDKNDIPFPQKDMVIA